jgi:hypothetical protein
VEKNRLERPRNESVEKVAHHLTKLCQTAMNSSFFAASARDVLLARRSTSLYGRPLESVY